MTQNVRGLGQEFKRRKLFYWLKKSSASVFFLQETHSTLEIEKQWKAEWGSNKCYFSHGSSNSRGVCILIKNNIPIDIENCIADEFGRYIIIEIKFNNSKILLCNIYGPNSDDPSFFQHVWWELEKLEYDNIIIGGDFNCILDPELDKVGGNPNRNKNARFMLCTLMEETDFVDIWRVKNPDLYQFTYRCTHPERITSRLDYFLVSFGLCDQIEKVSIMPGFMSDHSNVRVKINVKSLPKRPWFWKLNCQYLYDIDYVNMIKKTINETAEQNEGVDPNLRWEMIKLAIRGKSVEYSSKKKKSKENIISALEKRLKFLENKLETQQSGSIERSIKDIKDELEDYVAEKVRGAMVRSRAQWIEEGERSSKYFFGLEKRNFNAKNIQCLQTSSGMTVSDTQQILAEIKKFYIRLYSSGQKDNIPDFKEYDNLERPQLDSEEKEALDATITETEILNALKAFKNNKSPGTDGLPAEFYKVFWNDLKPFLLTSIQHGYDVGCLSYSQRQGVLTLIPKKEKDVLQIKNWRPISLLNVDYKLVAKLIANRIKTVIEKIIHKDQTGFINGRYIGENLLKIISIIEFCDENDIPGLLISIDFEKAYDQVEWNAIKYALKFFNFGTNIIKWITTMYKNVKSCVINNGHFSEFFTLERGVRQGCPLSPYLFIIVAELLALKIRGDSAIEGITVNDITHKLSQFADDTCIFTLFKQENLSAIFQTFDIFQKNAGLKINYNKTDILRLGSLRNSEAKLYTQKSLNWTNNPLLILGISITQSVKNLCECNFPQLLVKMQNIVDIWKMRDLTLYGKVLISKSLLISQLIYKLSILPDPGIDYMKEVNSLISKYVWGNKPPRLAKNILMQPLDKGGMKYIDIKIMNLGLKIAWVKRILEESNFEIRNLASITIPYSDGLIWVANLHQNDIGNIIKSQHQNIWTNILRAWCEYNYSVPQKVEEILCQSLWFNSLIRKQNKPFIEYNLLCLGIQYMKDIVGQDGKIKSASDIGILSQDASLILSYNQLVSAIPKTWKQTLKQENRNLGTVNILRENSNLNDIIVCGKIPRYICGKLIEKIPIDLSRKCKWEIDLSIQIHEQDWMGYFDILYSSTNNNKLKFFQYRLLHRFLTTNIDRYNWKQIESSSCQICGLHPETYLHLFIDCEYVKILWAKLFNWFARVTHLHYGIDSNLSKEEIILGLAINNDLDKLLNIILLITKQYIYAVKCASRHPNLNELYKRIYKQMLVDKHVAYKTNKLQSFNNIWGIIAW